MSGESLKDKPPKMENGRPIRVRRSELKEGDVLLSYGQHKVSDTIRWLDGGGFSHSSYFDGTHVVDSISEGGVGRRTPDWLVSKQRYVDVYRFVSDAGEPLEDPPAVTSAIHGYIGGEFAMDDLIFAAALVVSRRINLPGEAEDTLRWILSRAAKALTDLAPSNGRERMFCSELPYRGFNEAEPRPKFRLRISGRFEDLVRSGLDTPALLESELQRFGVRVLTPDRIGINLIEALTPRLGNQQLDELASSFVAIYRERVARHRIVQEVDAADLATLLGPASSGDGFSEAEPVMRIRDWLAGPDPRKIVADFVTPYDLQHSPNLHEIGRAFKEDYQ